jgi:DNA-binding response OmpR family regulator
MTRLLVVEDQKKLLQNLKRGLEQAGYEVAAATRGDDALQLARSEAFDAVVLDVMLPGQDGFSVLSTLRRQGYARPILILTARDGIDERVRGLDLGADDYLLKPFAMPELLARLRARLRGGPPGRETFLKAADLEMDLIARKVTRGGVEIDLTPREFALLEYLVRNKNTTATREMIARDVWNEPWGTPITNVLDVCIKVLRRKIETGGLPRLIQTVRGVGYRLEEK